MDKNLKFTDKETELFYDMINEWIEVHFQDNSEISFRNLYGLWCSNYRKEFWNECGLKVKPFQFMIGVRGWA